VFAAHGVTFRIADVARTAGPVDRSFPTTGDVPPASVAESFRRGRRLLTLDDLQAWWTAHAIDEDDFTAWTVDVSTGSESASDWCTWVCSGELDRATQRLAVAVAAACELGDAPAAAATFEVRDQADVLGARAATQDHLQEAVRRHRASWTRFVLDLVTTAERGVAEELRHWALSDGIGPATAAHQALLRANRFYGPLDELEPGSLRSALAGARQGEVIGPLATTDGWCLIAVQERREPALSDPVIETLARRVLQDEAINAAVVRHLGG
jgi:hypothetical protein